MFISLSQLFHGLARVEDVDRAVPAPPTATACPSSLARASSDRGLLSSNQSMALRISATTVSRLAPLLSLSLASSVSVRRASSHGPPILSSGLGAFFSP